MAEVVSQLSSTDCLDALSDAEIVDSMVRAFELTHLPEVARCQMSTASDADLVFGHASVLPGLGLCVKAGIQLPGNRDRGIEPVQATVTLFDAETGEPRAVLDGGAITAMRTAGALVAGVRAVGVPERPRVAVLGLGVQGRTVARLARTVLGAERVLGYARTPGAASEDFVAADSVEEAVRDADVIACCTTARAPLFGADRVRRGAVVASMGSYDPGLCELDPALVRDAGVVATDVPGQDFGPIARLRETGSALPDVHMLGAGQPPETDGTRCVLIGGTGVEDACAAWSVLLGWRAVDVLTRHYTRPRGAAGTAPATGDQGLA